MNENIPMNERELNIRSWLSEGAKKDFDDMYYARALGAASNIRAIGSMFGDMASTAAANGLTGAALIDRVHEVSRYFIEKRGASSHAIVTAIRIMTAPLDALADAPLDAVCSAVAEAYNTYQAETRGWNAHIMEYGWTILEPMDKILLFDYSSTVNAMMETAAAHGKLLDVYIPESHALDGGHQFLRNGVRMGHRMHYFPDAAIAHFAARVDAAFIGAETFYPDGSVSNTVGSDVTGIACAHCGTPLYVPTSLIKLNPRGYFGFKRREIIEDASAYFGLHLAPELREKIDLCSPGLINVPASLITAFITEVGVVPPQAMYEVGKTFLRRIGEEVSA